MDDIERACEAWHNADLESSRAWTPWSECLPEYKAHVRTCITAALDRLSATLAERDREAADYRFRINDLVSDKGRILCDVGRRDHEISQLRAENATQAAELGRMREALEPFAREAALTEEQEWFQRMPDDELVDTSFRAVDFRRAAAALRPAPATKEGEG